jgi:hypothetical protein
MWGARSTSFARYGISRPVAIWHQPFHDHRVPRRISSSEMAECAQIKPREPGVEGALKSILPRSAQERSCVRRFGRVCIFRVSRPDAPGVSGVSFGMRKCDEARWAGKATRRKRMGSDAATPSLKIRSAPGEPSLDASLLLPSVARPVVEDRRRRRIKQGAKVSRGAIKGRAARKEYYDSQGRPHEVRIAELKAHRFTSKTHHFKRADWATIRVSGWASGWVGGRGCIVYSKYKYSVW